MAQFAAYAAVSLSAAPEEEVEADLGLKEGLAPLGFPALALGERRYFNRFPLDPGLTGELARGLGLKVAVGLTRDLVSETPEEALAAHERGEVALNAPIKVAGRETSVGRLKYVFANPDEALLAVAHGIVDLQDVVTVRYMGKRLETSPGRILFARIVAEAVEDEKVAWELIQLDVPQEKNSLKDLVYQAFLRLGMEKTARLLDALKYYGFTFSTTSGITIGIDDAVIPEEKKQYLEEADRKLLQIEQAEQTGNRALWIRRGGFDVHALSLADFRLSTTSKHNSA